MDALIQFSQALADETRWRIVWLVFDEALCVCELTDILQLPTSSVSSHIQVIRKVGLLESERCEKWIYYRLDRRYHPLIKRLQEFFTDSSDGAAILKRDAARARQRLIQREKSCCPGPRKLARTRAGARGEAASSGQPIAI